MGHNLKALNADKHEPTLENENFEQRRADRFSFFIYLYLFNLYLTRQVS